MPHELTDLEIKEISFVNKGASGNGKLSPKIVFWKGLDPVAKKPSMIDRLATWFAKTEEPRTPEAMLEDLKSQLNPEQQDILMLLLAAAKAAPPDAEAAPATPRPAPETPADKADPEAPEMESEKAEDETDPEELAKLQKANPGLAAKIEKLQKAARDAKDENAALRKDLTSEVQKRRDAEYLAKAETFTFLPGDHEEVAKLLEAADRKLSGPEQDTLARLIKTTAGIVEKSELFKEKGNSQPSEDNGTTAGKLDAAIDKIMGDDKALTRPQAFRKALKDNPELRAEVDAASHPNVSMGR